MSSRMITSRATTVPVAWDGATGGVPGERQKESEGIANNAVWGLDLFLPVDSLVGSGLRKTKKTNTQTVAKSHEYGSAIGKESMGVRKRAQDKCQSRGGGEFISRFGTDAEKR